ncbi:hypothetical protein ACLBR5_17990 [Escherichia coli]
MATSNWRHNAWRDSNGQLRTTSHRYVSQLGAELFNRWFYRQ